MRDKTLRQVLLMVGVLSIISALLLYFTGRVKGLMDVFYLWVFGIIFLGEYVRMKLSNRKSE